MVTAITLNYNQSKYTIDCAQSVLDSDYGDFQLIIIDNGSTEENYQSLLSGLDLSNDRLRVVRLKDNVGYVGGVNIGLKKVFEEDNSDFCLVLNNDTLIDPGAISSLVETATKFENKAIVSGKVYHYDEPTYLQYIGNRKQPGILNYKSLVSGGRELDSGQFDQEMELDMLDDIFWLIPKSIFEVVGYYSDYFFLYGEQNDYAIRAIKSGFTLVYTPSAKIWHKGSITTADGDRDSPKLLYWKILSTCKLSVIHWTEKESKSFVENWKRKLLFRYLLKAILRQKSWNHYKAVVKAFSVFNHWNEVRYKDNGYNPF
ncbi:MAG: glycosyltransferase [Bacteroidetes bacterium]|nr:MAG: glycosyltransferase [Bacteroidota bacterium]